MIRTLTERFWEKVAVAGEDECWLWTASLDASGYGQLSAARVDNKPRPPLRAHRFSYEIAIGPIPDGLHVLHRCDVPACVNPAHLFLGTQAENMADACAKGRSVRGSQHPNARLTEEDVRTIRRLREGGLSNKPIAERFGITPNSAYEIGTRRRWRHVA